MKYSTRDLSMAAVFAALYAALVVAFSPISFGPIQLRVAGVIRPGIARTRVLAVAYALGVVVGNVVSPYAGVYELLFMPAASLAAGLIGYEAAKRLGGGYWVCGAVIGTIIPVAVAWMLQQLFALPIAVSLPGLFVSEQLVNIVGSMVFTALDRRFRWWQ